MKMNLCMFASVGRGDVHRHTQARTLVQRDICRDKDGSKQ